MYKRELKVLFVLSLLWVGLVTAAIPVTIEVTDVPDDSGDALKVVWVAEDPQFAVNFPSVTLQRTELGYLELALKGHKSNDAAPEEAKKEVLPTATVKFKTGTIPEVKSISIKNDGKTIVLLDASMKEVKSIQGKDTYDLLNKLKSQPGFVVNILNIQLVLNDAENLPLEAYKTVIEKREIGDSEYTDTDLEPSGKYKYKLIPLNKDGLPSEAICREQGNLPCCTMVSYGKAQYPYSCNNLLRTYTLVHKHCKEGEKPVYKKDQWAFSS